MQRLMVCRNDTLPLSKPFEEQLSESAKRRSSECLRRIGHGVNSPMTHRTRPFVGVSHEQTATVLGAARCWAAARMNKQPVLPELFAYLSAGRWEMAVISLDSVFRIYQSALGRVIVVGDGVEISNDEHALLNVLSGDSTLEVVLRPNETHIAVLTSALLSLRLVMKWEGLAYPVL